LPRDAFHRVHFAHIFTDFFVPAMPDAYDPYREKLVIETNTIWPDEFDHVEPADRARIEQRIHGNPEAAGSLEYVRVHSGFCRQVTVTAADLAGAD
jgi:hypothetical protein